MPVEVRGVIALRKALENFTPDLADDTQHEISQAIKPVVQTARGYIRKPHGLSSWFKHAGGSFPQANLTEARAGIFGNTEPSKPNRRGFVSLAHIDNASRSGAIMETAGRKNPQGRSPIMNTDLKAYGGVYGNEGRRSGKTRARREYRSNNPFAGYQFVSAMDQIGHITSIARGRKNKGRLIFRAWAKDQGRALTGVMKAIDTSKSKFYAQTGRKL